MATSLHRLQIIGYYRVSTRQQGHDGLGMEAQRRAVEAYAASRSMPIVASYAEVETGRRSDLRNRPQLTAALAHARRSKAILVIARLDRLARNVFVTAQLLESGVDFLACDMPFANRLTIQIMACMAEHESQMISERICAANAALRARGHDFRRPENRVSESAQKLGTIASARASVERSTRVYADIIPIVTTLRAASASLQRTADALNDMGHCTQRGGRWSSGTVYTLLRREGMSVEPPDTWIGSSERRQEQVARTTARYAELLSEISQRHGSAVTYANIADDFNARDLRTYRGYLWTAATINNLVQRQGRVRRAQRV